MASEDDLLPPTGLPPEEEQRQVQQVQNVDLSGLADGALAVPDVFGPVGEVVSAGGEVVAEVAGEAAGATGEVLGAVAEGAASGFSCVVALLALGLTAGSALAVTLLR